jgi:hypothetical protein
MMAKRKHRAAYNQRNGEKVAAWRKLNNAITSGLIVRGSCEVCGRQDRIEAHHTDYSKPLEVHWLCSEHHRMLTYHCARYRQIFHDISYRLAQFELLVPAAASLRIAKCLGHLPLQNLGSLFLAAPNTVAATPYVYGCYKFDFYR